MDMNRLDERVADMHMANEAIREHELEAKREMRKVYESCAVVEDSQRHVFETTCHQVSLCGKARAPFKYPGGKADHCSDCVELARAARKVDREMGRGLQKGRGEA